MFSMAAGDSKLSKLLESYLRSTGWLTAVRGNNVLAKRDELSVVIELEDIEGYVRIACPTNLELKSYEEMKRVLVKNFTWRGVKASLDPDGFLVLLVEVERARFEERVRSVTADALNKLAKSLRDICAELEKSSSRGTHESL
ncbi:MAG: hypothetical protein QXU97_01525 [Fervidicoccaceae archaeon]